MADCWAEMESTFIIGIYRAECASEDCGWGYQSRSNDPEFSPEDHFQEIEDHIEETGHMVMAKLTSYMIVHPDGTAVGNVDELRQVAE